MYSSTNNNNHQHQLNGTTSNNNNANYSVIGTAGGATRRRSLSATRSLTDSTVNFMGRIGASLRIASSSSRRRQKDEGMPTAAQQQQQSPPSDKSSPQNDKCKNTVIINNSGNNHVGRRQSLAEQWLRTVRLRRRSERMPQRECAGIRSEELTRKQFAINQQAREFLTTGAEQKELPEMEMFALIPPQALLDNEGQVRERRVMSPLSSSSFAGFGGSRSCPATPRPLRRRYLKEGVCQLTSIQTFTQHQRYMFVFDDLLLVCKQKGENNYKLKEKVALEFLWLSASNCTNSFLIGWPTTRNYIAQFSCEREKSDWFEKLHGAIQRRLRSKSTSVGVFVQIEGRQQLIRKEIRNGQKADELIEELRAELHLPVLDPHLGHYELCFCPGTTPKRARNPSSNSGAIVGPSPINDCFLNNNSDGPFLLNPNPTTTAFSNTAVAHQQQIHTAAAITSPSPALLRRVHSHTSIVAPLQQHLYNLQHQQTVHPLHGVENVYAIFMEFVRNQLGISLSDSQLAHLDTCPLVNCRLLLRQTGPHSTSSSSHPHKSSPFSLVNQFRRVLGRAESAVSAASAPNHASTAHSHPSLVGPTQKQKAHQKRLFGRQLHGSMPPQPVLTMIDHLLLYGADVEGIFRKSPKQQTVRVLRQQLDQGQVPDFHQFNVHVTASLLKDYLRSIPGQLLLAGNYRLWIDAISNEELTKEDRMERCRKLLALLPSAHTVLLRSLLRLLRKVKANEAQTKMGISALAVCIAPSLLEKLEQVESVRVVPQLVMFLIENAPILFDGFLEDGPLLPISSMSANACGLSPMHQSTDSGLSEVGAASALSSRSATVNAAANINNNNNSSSNPMQMGTKRRLLVRQHSGSISPDSGKLSSEPPSEDDDCRMGGSGGTNICAGNARQMIIGAGGVGHPIRWMKTHSLDDDDEEELGLSVDSEFSAISDNQIDYVDENVVNDGDYVGNEMIQELVDNEKTPVVLSRENSDVKDNCMKAASAIRSMSMAHNGSSNKNASKFAWRSQQLSREHSNITTTATGFVTGQHQQQRVIGTVAAAGRASRQNSASIACASPRMDSSRKCSNASSAAVVRNISPTDTVTPRKVSSASVDSDVCSQSSGGVAALSRRALLAATKSEAMGMMLMGSGGGDQQEQQRENGSRKSSLISSNGGSGAQQPQKAQLQRAHAFLSANAISATMNNSTRPLWTPQPEKRQQQQPVSAALYLLKNNGHALSGSSLGGSTASSACPSPCLSERSSLNAAQPTFRRFSAGTANGGGGFVIVRAPLLAAAQSAQNVDSFHLLKQQRRASAGGVQQQFGAPKPNRPPQPTAQQKYVPPKRTAEELVLLDKLEVNWSVPQIRKQFQLSAADAVPPVIDTLYAKLPTTANGGNTNKQPAAATAMVVGAVGGPK